MKYLIIGILLSFVNLRSSGESLLKSDTVILTIEEAEKKFIENNLLLILSKYNIEIARGYLIQSKLFNNPSLFLEQNIFNQYTRRAFDVTKTGQNIVQIQQLFLLANKRNKRINLDKINIELAEYEFYDLLRTLKYELRVSFYDLFFLQRSLLMYTEEIASLRKTVRLYDDQYKKGNIALKELVRLRAFLFDLENENKNLKNSITEKQANLKVLLLDTTHSYLVPIANKDSLDRLTIAPYSPEAIYDTAKVNRYDYKIQEANIRLEKGNLAYQKALAVPDVRLGGTYDRAGSYIQNYTGANLQIDLPVFNRNQGNIKIAKHRVEASKVAASNFSQQLKIEINEAVTKASLTDSVYKNFDQNFISDFTKLIEGILSNYEKKNISLIEFIDFYESYKKSVLEMNELQRDRIQYFESLNYYTGKNIIK